MLFLNRPNKRLLLEAALIRDTSVCAEIHLICLSHKGDVCEPLAHGLSWSQPDWACTEGVCAVSSHQVSFPAIFHHSKGWGKGGRVKQADSFGQYHFLAWLYSMRLTK